jgi:hypothetical protein
MLLRVIDCDANLRWGGAALYFIDGVEASRDRSL